MRLVVRLVDMFAVVAFSLLWATLPEVRICALLPKWRTSGVSIDKGFKRLAVLQAALGMINARTDLLPNTQLLRDLHLEPGLQPTRCEPLNY